MFFLNNGNPIPKGIVVDHIDTDRSNNRVSNLRLCTHKENMNNSKTISKRGWIIKCVDKVRNLIYYFPSLNACEKVLGLFPDQIQYCIKEGENGNIYFPDLIFYRLNNDKLTNDISFVKTIEELLGQKKYIPGSSDNRLRRNYRYGKDCN